MLRMLQRGQLPPPAVACPCCIAMRCPRRLQACAEPPSAAARALKSPREAVRRPIFGGANSGAASPHRSAMVHLWRAESKIASYKSRILVNSGMRFRVAILSDQCVLRAWNALGPLTRNAPRSCPLEKNIRPRLRRSKQQSSHFPVPSTLAVPADRKGDFWFLLIHIS